MSEFLKRLWRGSRKHAADDELLRLADGELGAWHARRVQRHMELCWACRSRYEQVQGAIVEFVEYRKRIVAPHLPRPRSARDQFLRKLEEAARETPAWPVRAAYYLRSLVTPPANAVFAPAAILVILALAVFVVWQRNAPTVSASELLDRAQLWDTNPAGGAHDGVIYQKVEIRSGADAYDLPLYRDIQGRRRPHRADLSSHVAFLQKALEAAGVDWQRPLSAFDFRNWSEHLADRNYEVISNRSGTLTLRTTTNYGDVPEETLTVRTSDFHPVARQVMFRNRVEVDIVELNYRVLAWNEVNAAELFESANASLATSIVTAAPRKPMVILPSAAALDEAELRARLALGEISADTGEDIRIAPTKTGITVSGFVETPVRKREIVQALSGVPLVKTSISTFDVRSQQVVESEQAPASTVSRQDVIVQGSPLEVYFADRSISREQSVQFSRELFDQALEIDRESLALDSLEKRFSPEAQSTFTPENAALFRELFGRHLSALHAAIVEEQHLIGAYVPGSTPGTQPAPASGFTTAELRQLSAENRQLADELLAHGRDGQRAADLILSELTSSLNRCAQISDSLGHGN